MPCPDPDGPGTSDEASQGEDLEFEAAFYEAILAKAPDSVDILMALGNNYIRLGLYDKGLGIDRRLCQLRANDPVVHYNLACTHSLLGRVEESLEALEGAIGLGYSDFAHMQHDPDLEGLRADPHYLVLVERLCELRADDPDVRYTLACNYSRLRRIDESFDALQQAIRLGYRDVARMQRDPDLEGVRSDPRYPLLVERIARGELRA